MLTWDKTGAGTRFTPPPPPPPVAIDGEMPVQPNPEENEEERNKFERQERLGHLLTAEVHEKEFEWLDYETEDTQVRFDVADMILEELASEVTEFLMQRNGGAQLVAEQQDEYYNDY